MDEEHGKLRGVDVKFISSDLPRPSLAEEGCYGGGGVKKSAPARVRRDEVEAVKLFLTGDDGSSGGARF